MHTFPQVKETRPIQKELNRLISNLEKCDPKEPLLIVQSIAHGNDLTYSTMTELEASAAKNAKKILAILCRVRNLRELEGDN